MDRKGLPKEVMFEPRSNQTGRSKPCANLRENVLGGGESIYKGLEAGSCSVCLTNSRRPVCLPGCGLGEEV